MAVWWKGIAHSSSFPESCQCCSPRIHDHVPPKRVPSSRPTRSCERVCLRVSLRYRIVGVDTVSRPRNKRIRTDCRREPTSTPNTPDCGGPSNSRKPTWVSKNPAIWACDLSIVGTMTRAGVNGHGHPQRDFPKEWRGPNCWTERRHSV